MKSLIYAYEHMEGTMEGKKEEAIDRQETKDMEFTPEEKAERLRILKSMFRNDEERRKDKEEEEHKTVSGGGPYIVLPDVKVNMLGSGMREEEIPVLILVTDRGKGGRIINVREDLIMIDGKILARCGTKMTQEAIDRLNGKDGIVVGVDVKVYSDKED